MDENKNVEERSQEAEEEVESQETQPICLRLTVSRDDRSARKGILMFENLDPKVLITYIEGCVKCG